ncbi:MAG TPA: hypothetical protein VEI73_00405 [Candidatus Acidoferrum sp.]|nr:hypothetical protein [Candidatus Acidoferrum sp.]
MPGSEALVMAAWLTGFGWFAKQARDYLKEKSKVESEKAAVTSVKPAAEPLKGSQPLPLGMKPMIGPQWPVKAGPFPARPGLRTFPSIRKTEDRAPAPAPATPVSTAPGPATPDNANKPGFIYQRPTLPERKPKLPYNWPGQRDKKPKR